MDNIIISSCNKLQHYLYEDISKEDFFQQCVEDRLLAIYYREDKEFDSMISKLESSIDFDDFYGVKRCVVKIAKALSRNRNKLISTIERIVK